MRIGVLLLNDKNVLMNCIFVVCDWFFFGRVEIFVGILIINGKIVLVLNLKKRKIFKMDLLFVDVDKKIEECIRF